MGGRPCVQGFAGASYMSNPWGNLTVSGYSCISSLQISTRLGTYVHSVHPSLQSYRRVAVTISIVLMRKLGREESRHLLRVSELVNSSLEVQDQVAWLQRQRTGCSISLQMKQSTCLLWDIPSGVLCLLRSCCEI